MDAEFASLRGFSNLNYSISDPPSSIDHIFRKLDPLGISMAVDCFKSRDDGGAKNCASGGAVPQLT